MPNLKLYDLMVKKGVDWPWGWDKAILHIRWWIEGWPYPDLCIFTEHSYHLLYKHGKPRKLRKAK